MTGDYPKIISSPGKIPRVLLVLLFLSLVLIYVNLSFFSKNPKMNLSLLVTFVETVKKEVSFAAVFRDVTQRYLEGALRDIPKDGSEGDY